jgi:hypothetical protein
MEDVYEVDGIGIPYRSFEMTSNHRTWGAIALTSSDKIIAIRADNKQVWRVIMLDGNDHASEKSSMRRSKVHETFRAYTASRMPPSVSCAVKVPYKLRDSSSHELKTHVTNSQCCLKRSSTWQSRVHVTGVYCLVMVLNAPRSLHNPRTDNNEDEGHFMVT